MSEVAIKVEGLSKRFEIGHLVQGDLRSSLTSKFQRLIGRPVTSKEDFWALRDVSFEIKQGEAVGIIGRNGAGKSTLLKLLSRITDPSSGRFEINGRVSSLLEVGTGFHQELTGRENIYLNGTILGMKRAEIKNKFDEIVAFSGVERFIDTPVKHYSSGMKVRLAFSVAAHLEPEILIIDEVLAVGDAEFQKKCLGKMDEVSKNEGRTVLFVSHNMGAIQNLCSRGILLSSGSVLADTTVHEAIRHYTKSISAGHDNSIEMAANRAGTQEVIFSQVYFVDQSGETIDMIMAGTDVSIRTVLKVKNSVEKVDIGFSFHDEFDSINAVIYSSYQGVYFNLSPGEHCLTFTMKDISLSSGNWSIRGLIKANAIVSDWPKFPLLNFNIQIGNFYGTGHGGDSTNDTKFLVKGDWKIESK